MFLLYMNARPQTQLSHHLSLLFQPSVQIYDVNDLLLVTNDVKFHIINTS